MRSPWIRDVCWRWRGGRLFLIAREGDTANNTVDIIRSIGSFACSGTGGVAFDVSFVPGFGNATSTTNLGIFLDRGAADPAPLLVLRRSDTFEIDGTTYSVAGMKISTESNPGGGTGGFGRALNDAGDILLNLTLSGNTSGLFLLGTPPPN
jgi:hypothetical protein